MRARVLLVAAAVWLVVPASSRPQAAPQVSAYQPVLDRYCISCHNDRLKTGDLNLQASDLNQDEAEKFGAIVGALVGFGAGGEEEMESGALAGAQELEDGHLLDDQAVWYLSDAIPQGTAAAVALIEHRWAIPLRDKIAKAGGVTLADEWIHAADLIAVGLVRSSTGETAGASA